MGSGEQIQVFLLASQVCYRLCLQSCLFNILVNIFHTDHTFSISIESFIIPPAWLMFVSHLKYSSETYHELSILCFILEFAYLNPQILFSWWRTQFIFVGDQEECKGKEMFIYLTGSITSIGMFCRLWAKCRYWQNTLSQINNRYGTRDKEHRKELSEHIIYHQNYDTQAEESKVRVLQVQLEV